MLSLHLVVIWWAGRKFGAPLLFWHHLWNVAFLAGVGVSLTLAFFLFIFFVLDYSAWFTETRNILAMWNRDREKLREETEACLSSLPSPPSWAERLGVLDYSAWFRETRNRFASWYRNRELCGDSEVQLSGLPIPPHWSTRLSDHFDRFFLNEIRMCQEAPGPGERKGQLRDFGVELQRQSFLFRSLTNSFAYLFTGIFLLRLLIFALRRLWNSSPTLAAHGSFDIWNESVRFHDGMWWLFVGGMAAGAALVPLIDQVKFWLVPSLGKVAIGDPVPVLHWFDRRLVWTREFAMMILGLWSLLILTLTHLLILAAGEAGGRYYAAPAICVMLAWFVLAYGMLVLQTRRTLWFPRLALFTLFAAVATFPFLQGRYGFPTLESTSGSDRILPPIQSVYPGPNPSVAGDAQRERANALAARDREADRHGRLFAQSDAVADWSGGPLVVVCASGGGIIAEVWAIEVLSVLDRRSRGELGRNVRLVTGASGGMVGASAWVGEMFGRWNKDMPLPLPPPAPLRDRCHGDQLSPAALRLALYDSNVVAFVFQRTIAGLRYWDRGQVLEETWTHPRRGLLHELRFTLADLRPAEESGALPSLLFSPTIAEQGRPLLVSNLDVSRIKDVVLPGANQMRQVVIHRAVDAREFLGGQAVDATPLSTWARMSATFPVISPAGYVEYGYLDPGGQKRSRGRIHIVDAGYTDNQGTSLALAWLRSYWLPWARHDPAKAPRHVILLELDAFPRYGSRARQEPKQAFPLLRGFQATVEDLSIPLAGLGNRMKSHLFDTDHMLQEFANQAAERDLSFTTFRFVNPLPVSLSWYLSPQEIAQLAWFRRLFDQLARGAQQREIEQWLQNERQTGDSMPVDLADPFLSDSLREYFDLASYWESRPWASRPPPARTAAHEVDRD